MAGVSAAQGLFFAPLAALAVVVLAHIVLSRLLHGSRQIVCLAVATVAGMAFLTMLGTALLGPSRWDLDAWGQLLLSLLTYLALAFGYANFSNLNLSSLRIRLLRELSEAPRGLTEGEILRRYNSRQIIEGRLERFLAADHLLERGGRYFLGGNRTFLRLFHLFEMLKYFVLGRGSELLRSTRSPRDPQGGSHCER